MVIDKICKMTAKGVNLKSESFFSISYGVLELRRKTLRGTDSPVLIGLREVSSLPGEGGEKFQGSEGEGGRHLVCNYC